MFHSTDEQINVSDAYVSIKMLWNLSVAELQSGSIVESICSTVKKIHTPDRNELNQLTVEIVNQLRSSIPTSKKDVQKCQE